MKHETMSSKELDTVSLYHTVSCTGKHYFTASFFCNSKLLLKICKYRYFTLCLNILLCYLHILVYTLNIHESHSAEVGHLHRPSWYAAFYTTLNASA